MKTQRQICCVGELIVDFVSTKEGAALAAAPGFLKHAGGAGANVAAGLSRLGVRTAFIGTVGRDPFGTFLKRELAGAGVNTSGLRTDDAHRTRLAFVSRPAPGEREFAFWEERPADEFLSPGEIGFRIIARSHIVHLSSFLLLKEPARSTALRIAQKAARSGQMVSFDPNIRFSLWASRGEARRCILEMVRLSSVLRLNDAEARFLTGSSTVPGAARKLLGLGPLLVVITAGRRGCHAFNGRVSVSTAGFPVRTVDTTGCGDGFLAALLFGILKSETRIGDLTAPALESICRFANAAGALTSATFGVITALPTLSQVGTFLKSRRNR